MPLIEHTFPLSRHGDPVEPLRQDDRPSHVHAQGQPQLRALLPGVLPFGRVQPAAEAEDARTVRHTFGEVAAQ